MGNLNIDEIRAKADALRAGEYDGITVYDHAHDLDALCDEVEADRARIAELKKQVQAALGTANMWTDAEEKQRKETAVLKRALEISIETVSPYVRPVTKWEMCKHYIQRARKEMKK